MKKIFFYSSLLAFATSCTNEFDALDVQNEKAQGISFKTETVDSRMLWEDTGTSYSPFWYAEIDRINVYGAGCLATGDPASTTTALTGVQAENGWKRIASPYVYKATQSKKNGVFTSRDIASTWSYAGDKEAAFVATYPTGMTASYASGKYIDFANWAPAATQDQLGVQGDNKAQVMYAFAKATRENSYDAVGETVGLSFVRPLKALVFSTANADEYTKGATSVFGKLNSIKFTTKGIDANGDSDWADEGEIAPTALTYSAGATLKVDTTATTEPIITIDEVNTPVSTITLEFNNGAGQEWSDDALAIMAIVPNDRPKYANVEEPAEVVFSFDHIDLTHKTFTKISKNVKLNKYMEVKALDIQDYPYLVTKGTSGSERTLIVNGGEGFDFTSIFNNDGDIIWTDEFATAAVDKDNFTQVIVDSDVEITTLGFAKLEAMSAITHLTLKGVTSVPAEALDGLANLAYLNMPEATTITATSFDNTNLETVLLPKFDFSVSKTITESLLNADKLVTLDMSGVSSMKAAFPNEGFTLDGFEHLENLTVKEGLEVGAGAFANCTSLSTINAAVNLIGAGAFESTALTSLAITNTVIPANAFKNAASLTKVTGKNGATLQPTEVGNNAFVGTKIEYLDLSKTTYIGENAFNAVTTYKGAYHDNVKNLDILYVGATEIGANAFNGATGLKYVEFSNLKNVSSGMMLGATGLLEVKFKEVLNAPATDLTAVFDATMNNTTLFLNQKQTSDFYAGNTFYVNGDAKGTGTRVESAFGKIQFE